MLSTAKRTALRRLGVPVALLALLAGTLTAPAGASAPSMGDWPMGGGNILDSRSNPFEHTISASNASRLALKWSATTHGDVSATPAVVNGAVYFPDWGGYLTKLDASTGRTVWSHEISDYDGVAGSMSRTSPVVVDGVVYIGDRLQSNLIAIDAGTGELRWLTNLDPDPTAMLTESPSVYDGIVYEGISSQESGLAGNPDYPCCTFRGAVTATDVTTGKLLWRQYVLPDNGGKPGGYSGGAVWGGTPAIDPLHGTVFVTTGQNYSVPRSVLDCEAGGGTPAQCFSPDNHIESVIALDLRTGAIKWATGAKTFDTWNFGCIPGYPPNNCPADPGKDYDFSDGAHVFAIPNGNGGAREVVGGGAKSGQYWLLDAVTGQVIWSAAPGPGSDSGGIMWGTSADGNRIYLNEADSAKQPYTLPDGTTTTSASVAALDPSTGKALWQVTDPSGGFLIAPVTSANGVVYTSSSSGHMYALNAATGKVLFDYQGQFSSNAGAAVVDGTVYWGNGYANGGASSGYTGSATTGTFYAFSIGGR